MITDRGSISPVAFHPSQLCALARDVDGIYARVLSFSLRSPVSRPSFLPLFNLGGRTSFVFWFRGLRQYCASVGRKTLSIAKKGA